MMDEKGESVLQKSVEQIVEDLSSGVRDGFKKGTGLDADDKLKDYSKIL